MTKQRESQTIAVPTRYRVIGKLGSGGMSHVYEAHDTVLDVTVAIKILQMEGKGPEQVLRFQREAKATAALKHDNIVKILDFGLTDDAVPYMVLDRIDGKSLKEVIENDGPLSLERAIAVFSQVCSGLAHAHKNGIIHRDLKPSNIVFATGEHGEEIVKVIDFGIARIEDNASLTRTNAVIGSPPYMSPEQAAGCDISTTSDIYSLGCVLFEALTGKTPFLGQTSIETIMMQMNDTPPRLADFVDKEFPEPLEHLVSTLLAKEPADRPQSMERVLSALREIEPATTAGIKDEETPPSTTIEFAKGALIVLTAIGVVVILVVGTVLFIEFYMNESERVNSLGKKGTAKDESKPGKKMLGPTLLLSLIHI